MDNETTALATISGNTQAPPVILDRAISLMPVGQMQPVLAEYESRRKAFRDWLLGQLKEGVHFGVPPGCEPAGKVNPKQWQHKPSLYKAGADFICDLLMLRPAFEPDMVSWEMLGKREGTVCIACRLIVDKPTPFFDLPAGAIAGEGRGAGVAGVKKRDANGAIKIAQKCAKVDAVINALGLSDLFTQDMEKPPAEPRDAPTAAPDAPKVAPREQRQEKPQPSETMQAVVALYRKWCAKKNVPTKTKDEQAAARTAFQAWAKKTLRTERDMSGESDWTLDAVEACGGAL